MNQDLVSQNKEDFTQTSSFIANQKLKILEVQETKVKQILEKLKIQQEQNIQKVNEKVENQEHQIVSLQDKPYEIIQEYTKKQSDWCNTIAFNREQNIMVAGCNSKITVFEFKQGQLNQLQILNDHTQNINTLYFMAKQNQFISGTINGGIGIWNYNTTTKQYCSLQMIRQAHQNHVNRVIMNKNEDSIISCSYDKTIKFWIRKNEWECLQTLTNHTNYVRDICLNESCTQLVSCGDDNQILISQQGGDQKWRKFQRIKIEIDGVRICYINDNLIAFQPYQQSKMEIYQLDQQNKQFNKCKDVPVNNDGYCNTLFPMQFNNNKQLLLNKNSYCVNLIRKQNNEFMVEQSINFNTNHIYGKMTDDFKYLITWDWKSKEFQVRKQK